MPLEPLHVLQRRFWRLITEPRGVASTLAELAKDDPSAAPLAGWIAQDDEDAARERLEVYADMYFFRLLDALKSEVPKVAQWMGDDDFHDLVADYLVAHPSTRPSLRHSAAALPGFLASHVAGAACPGLPDLARLELARNDAFDGPESPRLEAQALAALPTDAWPRLCFHVAPTVRRLRLRTSTIPTWRALADGRPPPRTSADIGGCIVWRSRAPGAEDEVWHRAVCQTELEALGAAAAGATFDRLCEILAAGLDPRLVNATDAARPALEVLLRWLRDGLLSGVELVSSPEDRPHCRSFSASPPKSETPPPYDGEFAA